jgi:hypothetical protein
MTRRATGTYEIQNWEEQTYLELGDGAKLSRARITNAYHGDIEGEGTLEYLMFYPDAESASLVGHERVVGRLGDRAGSFVLQHTATYGAGMAQGTFIVVPGSATGELRGLRGEGGWVAQHGDRATITTWFASEPTPPRIARWGLEYDVE